jgi:hypothetical protein
MAKSLIKPPVRLAKQPKQMLMCLCQLEHNGPLACLTQPVHANKILQHPTRRRLVNPCPLLVGTGRPMVLQGSAEAIFPSGVHSSTHRHHHPQCHETFGLVEGECCGETLRSFQKAEPAFRRPLAFVPGEYLLR